MKTVRGALLVVLAATACACINPTIRESFTQASLDRAVFELGCPKEKITLVPLNLPLEKPIEYGAQIGVVGCEKRAVYVATAGAGWVLNSRPEGK